MTGLVHRTHSLRILVALAGTFLGSSALAAQSTVRMSDNQVLASETYVRPPAVIERIITTPRTDISFTQPSPDRSWFLRTTGMDRGDVAQFGKPHVYLGGIQVETRANRARSLTTSTRLGLVLVDPRSGATRALETPLNASISSPVWSPTSQEVAYIANFAEASHVFVADVPTGKSVQVTKTPVLATLVTTVAWTADGKSLVAVVLPDARGPAPLHGNDGIEDGPEVRLSESRALPQRIYPSLIEDPHEKAMLEYYTTGQLVLIDVKTKNARKIGAPGMFRSVDPSSDGRYFLVTQMTQPFSYIVPVSSFGSTQQLWDATGKVVAQLTTVALREGDQGGDGDAGGGGRGGEPSASQPGKRSVQWNPVAPGLVYFESVFPAASGDERPKPTSVRYVSWVAPYGPGDTKVLHEGSPEMTAASFSDDGRTLFVSEAGAVIAIRTDDPSRRFNLGTSVRLGGARRGGGGGDDDDRDDPADLGTLATRRGPNGLPVVIVAGDGKTVMLSGTRAPGASWTSEAPRPWVDKLDIESGRRERIFESPANQYEEIVTALDDDYSAYIYTRESPSVIKDAFLHDTRTGANTQLTQASDVAPEVSGAQRKRLRVTRLRDGVRFWVDVTLPAEWRPGTRLPGVIWFYPREYTSQRDYDRSRYSTNINRFPDSPALRPASMTQLWVTQGYALIEPDSPIMGDPGRMNDNYVGDLKENLDAVIDAVVDAGYVDRNRMGVGGHSYGGFSTVNALTLTSYFKAGIAGDGMYNRSLTPFGFQSERRSFFEAQETYLDMSPFYRADKISGALLLYHSDEDQNVGTAPISSIRMFHALQGLGKPAAMYMYPYEDHSVATYQTDLDQWARWIAWFDLYVKKAPAGSVTDSSQR